MTRVWLIEGHFWVCGWHQALCSGAVLASLKHMSGSLIFHFNFLLLLCREHCLLPSCRYFTRACCSASVRSCVPSLGCPPMSCCLLQSLTGWEAHLSPKPLWFLHRWGWHGSTWLYLSYRKHLILNCVNTYLFFKKAIMSNVLLFLPEPIIFSWKVLKNVCWINFPQLTQILNFSFFFRNKNYQPSIFSIGLGVFLCNEDRKLALSSLLFTSLPQWTAAGTSAGCAQGPVCRAGKDLKVKAPGEPSLTVLWFSEVVGAPLALQFLPALLMPKAELNC